MIRIGDAEPVSLKRNKSRRKFIIVRKIRIFGFFITALLFLIKTI
jgi:hypothetical protein